MHTANDFDEADRNANIGTGLITGNVVRSTSQGLVEYNTRQLDTRSPGAATDEFYDHDQPYR